ncbi:formyltransferase family protein [Neptuniibacter sp.]|uniref:formyltransferase family protein n=1 Tax=Neptuniibacter sp. TaxID=1962643 RepID=UPI003B5BE98B
MQISILCSDEDHPINSYLQRWIVKWNKTHEISLVRKKKDLSGGDILFLISCAEFITSEDRSLFRNNLVIHASDLPKGRGWSPVVWQLLEGESEITVTLLEADEKVDSGDIWKKIRCLIPKDALWDEINNHLFQAEIDLMDYGVEFCNEVNPVKQSSDVKPTYYPRRLPKDSEIDPEESIVSQFDRIRVSDPNRYPAFFELHGTRYKLVLEKIHE